MSFEVEDKDVELDLSNLIGVNLTFGPLQLTLQNIVKRLAALEQDNARKSEEINALNDAVEELRAKEEERSNKDNDDGADGTCNADEHDAIWAEIDKLNNLLGEVTGLERQRHSIDELYAARKRRDSHQQHASALQTPSKRPMSGQEAVLSAYESSSRPLSSSLRKPPQPPQPPLTSTEEARSSPTDGEQEADHLTAYEFDSTAALGDKVLSKAHEPLPGFDETRRFSGGSGSRQPIGSSDEDDAEGLAREGTEAGDAAGGDSMQPHPGSAEGRESTLPQEHSDGQGGSPVGTTRVSTGDGSTGPARRRSHVHSHSPTGAATVSDRLRKDSSDIAYLNRVVAEILGEMKSLHDNVDLLQTVSNAGRAPGDDESTLARLRELEKRVAVQQDELGRGQDDSNDLRERLEELKRAVKPATRMTEDDVDEVKAVPALTGRVRALENAQKAAEQAHERLEEKLQYVVDATGGAGGEPIEGINAVQFALLQGTVKALEKQLEELQRNAGNGNGAGGADMEEAIARLKDAVRRLQEEVSTLETTVDHHDRDIARLDEVKADRSDVLGALADLREAVARLEADNGGENHKMNDAIDTRLNDLQTALQDALERISKLQDDKAERSAVQRLRDDLVALKRLMEVNMQRDAASAKDGAGGSAAGGGFGGAMNEALLREIQQQLLAQAESSSKDRDTTDEELDVLRDLIDQLDRRKADGTLVANKAERDYVENALERLMREVEQVLNATNAGLIDTLDKSLNILRDMIDGKANKHDIQRLQQQMAAEGAGGASAADGLTGFKGYRCLGCNRQMETLRPRSTAAKMNPFLNRNPQNYPQDNVTRSIQQQQQQSLLLGGAAHSDPLPPIEGQR